MSKVERPATGNPTALQSISVIFAQNRICGNWRRIFDRHAFNKRITTFAKPLLLRSRTLCPALFPVRRASFCAKNEAAARNPDGGFL